MNGIDRGQGDESAFIRLRFWMCIICDAFTFVRLVLEVVANPPCEFLAARYFAAPQVEQKYLFVGWTCYPATG